MLLGTSTSAELDSRIRALEHALKSTPDADSLRHSFFSFGKWICKYPPSREDNWEHEIDRYVQLLEFPLVQQKVASEFLLCLGLFMVCHPCSISTKRRAEWSNKLSQLEVVVSTCSELLLYSLVHSYLKRRDVSSSTHFAGCMDDSIQLLKRVSGVVDSASSCTTVLSDVFPLLLSIQQLHMMQRQMTTPCGLRMDRLCSLLSEFSLAISKLLQFVRQHDGERQVDKRRLESAVDALMHAMFGYFVDCVSLYEDALFPVAGRLVVFVLQWLETCDTWEWRRVGKKLGYQMVDILFQHHMFQSERADRLQFLRLVQSEMARGYQQVSKYCGERLLLQQPEEMRMTDRMDNRIEPGDEDGLESLVWALQSFTMYHQSIFYTLEREQQVIEKRNALNRWLLNFCEMAEQIPALVSLRNILLQCRRGLHFATQRTTLLLSDASAKQVSACIHSTHDQSDSETQARAEKRPKIKHCKEEKCTPTEWKIVHPNAPVNILPSEESKDVVSSNTYTSPTVEEEEKEVHYGSFYGEQQHIQSEPKDIYVKRQLTEKDNQENPSQSSSSDVDAIVDEIDLEITS